MKRLILVGTLAVGVGLAGLCLGQETTDSANKLPSNQEQLKALAYFLGGWELTGEVNLAGKPTIVFTYERQFKWDLGNNFIQTTTTETKDGKAELRQRSMIGWEAKPQRITEWGFWNAYPPSELPAWAETVTWSKEGENWRIEREGVSGLFTIIDQNTHKYECTFRGDDGSENSWHYTATRKTMTPTPQVKQTALPDDIVKEMRFFVGEWTVEGEVLGKALKGRWSAKWSPEKHCLVIRYPLALDGEEIFGNGVMGWDTATKKLLIQMFYSNGVIETVRYTVESPGVFKGAFAGSAGGEASTATCEVRTKRPNEWTFQTTGHTVGGKQEGELSVRFVRTEPKPTKKSIQ
ncbi:MAG: hypothetical protein ACYC0X_27335 [Pirellulaceae bacterium]